MIIEMRIIAFNCILNRDKEQYNFEHFYSFTNNILNKNIIKKLPWHL